MRLYQQFRASIARSTVVGAGVLLFASGMSVSAFGQTQQASAAAAGGHPGPPGPAVPAGTPVSIEEAVRMALENNLGIQIEKLNPQIEVLGVSRARAVYTPSLVSGLSRRSSHVAADRLQHLRRRPGGLHQRQLLRQRRPAAAAEVGRRHYSVVVRRVEGDDATTSTRGSIPSSDRASTPPSPSRCCATSRSTRTASSSCWRRTSCEAADLQLQQRLTQTGRSVRAAYYALVGAIAGLEVAQESLNLSRTSLKNNQTRVEVGTMAPIDIVDRGGGSREQRGERHHPAGRGSRARRTSCAR